MTLQVKLLREDAILPRRINSTDAGLDIFLCEETHTCFAGCRSVAATGIAVAIPNGYYGRIAPRSGLAVRYGVDVLAGVVDSSYRGEIKVVLFNTDERPHTFVQGARIAQLIIEKIALPVVVEVSDLDETSRGDDGFGSTGV